MRGVDWRVDVKSSSDKVARMAQPTVIVNIQVCVHGVHGVMVCVVCVPPDPDAVCGIAWLSKVMPCDVQVMKPSNGAAVM